MSTRTHASPCGCHDSWQETQLAEGRLEHLRRVVGHAARFLPVQGPLGVFVHYNTLRSLQHRRFEEAVLEGAGLYKAEPYLSEEAYQLERGRGRILDEDIDAVLSREPDLEFLPGRLSRRALRRAMLIPGVRRVNGINISWQLEEGGWLDSFRSDLPPASAAALCGDSPQALWEVCLARVKPQPAPPPVMPKRPRDVVLAQHGIDMDALIHPPLIRLTGAYLDQGIAYWPMPHRDKGLLKAARKIMPQPFAIFPAHLGGVRTAFLRQEAAGMDAETVVLEALEQLGVPLSHWEDFVTEELLALRGWAGMVHMLEQDPSLAPHLHRGGSQGHRWRHLGMALHTGAGAPF